MGNRKTKTQKNKIIDTENRRLVVARGGVGEGEGWEECVKKKLRKNSSPSSHHLLRGLLQQFFL